MLNEVYIEYKGMSDSSFCCGLVFGDIPSYIVVDATDSSNQVTEIRCGLVKKYVKDHLNAQLNATKLELEQ